MILTVIGLGYRAKYGYLSVYQQINYFPQPSASTNN